MKIQPTQDHVLVRRDVAAEMVGGLYIAEAHRDLPWRGTVEAVGRGRVHDSGRFVETTVKVGDVVYIPRHGHWHELEPNLLMIREAEILAVEEPA